MMPPIYVIKHSAGPETRRTCLASVTNPTLFLFSPDKLDIKRHLHGIFYLSEIYFHSVPQYIIKSIVFWTENLIIIMK